MRPGRRWARRPAPRPDPGSLRAVRPRGLGGRGAWARRRIPHLAADPELACRRHPLGQPGAGPASEAHRRGGASRMRARWPSAWITSACSRWSCSCMTGDCWATRWRRACTTPATGPLKARSQPVPEPRARGAGPAAGRYRARAGRALMFNWIGELPDVSGRAGRRTCHWHDYGKSPRPGRKVGPRHPVRRPTRSCATALGAWPTRWIATTQVAPMLAVSRCAAARPDHACARRPPRITKTAVPGGRPCVQPRAAPHAILAGGELPVDQVPERLDVLRPRVAVVDVVGVLPHVAGQQRLVARRSPAWPALDVLTRASEPSARCTSQAQPEPNVPAAVLLNSSLNLANRRTPCRSRRPACRTGRRRRWAQAIPVEGVVPDLGGVVEHAALGLPDDVLQRHVGEFGALDLLVELVDVGLWCLP